MKDWLKKWIPTAQTIKKSNSLKSLKPYLHSSTLWAYDRESVARGIAAGLAGAVIPGFQIFYAASLVILFRGNLPIALLATLVTNPLTALPIIYFIYYVGTLIVGKGGSDTMQNFHWDFSTLYSFWTSFSTWMVQFGKAFFVGVPIVSTALAIIGYFGTILIWKVSVFFIKHYQKKFPNKKV